jgi:hypothetical protein
MTSDTFRLALPAADAADVELPAHPHHGEAALHEETVAEVGLGHRIVGGATVEAAEHDLPAPVQHVHECDAVRFRGVERTQDVNVARELHLAIEIHRRLVDIRNHGVAGRAWIHREVGDADDLLVAGTADRRAARDVEAHHVRPGLAGPGEQEADNRQTARASGARRHAAQYSAAGRPSPAATPMAGSMLAWTSSASSARSTSRNRPPMRSSRRRSSPAGTVPA